MSDNTGHASERDMDTIGTILYYNFSDVTMSHYGKFLSLLMFDRGLYTPPRVPLDSSRLRRTQILECVGVTRAKLACSVREESTGVHRNMVNSAE